ncbi:MAG: hypothetical protein K5945_05360 [Bacteroidaceae bacterium]|nr:hypothetical protein [Bacteroidaceae bacterium]
MNKLIDKYLSGSSTREEEQALRRMLDDAVLLTPEQRIVQAMLQAEPMQAEPQWLTEDDSDEYDRLVAVRYSRVRLLWRWVSVAAVVCVAVGIAIALFTSHEPTNCTVACIYGQETTDEALVLSMMEGTMQSVLACSSTESLEGQLTDILNP